MTNNSLNVYINCTWKSPARTICDHERKKCQKSSGARAILKFAEMERRQF